jgi:hypothetical protein
MLRLVLHLGEREVSFATDSTVAPELAHWRGARTRMTLIPSYMLVRQLKSCFGLKAATLLDKCVSPLRAEVSLPDRPATPRPALGARARAGGGAEASQ